MVAGLDEFPEVRELNPAQRRVVGVLLEKGKTTPEYYPMTLKGLTTGCNQKNNRDPVVDYSEDFVEDTLHSLQRIGLTEELYPETGRALRYRHFFRKRYPLTEPQVAIMTELFLRGRQSLGELRTRASRMEPIEDLESLRTEVRSLIEGGYVKVNGPVESRGVEIDHNFYLPTEKSALPAFSGQPAESEMAGAVTPAVGRMPIAPVAPVANQELTRLIEAHDALREEVVSLRAIVERLQDRLDKLASDLGVS